MTEETYAPMPRWLYLVYKPAATLAIAVGIATVTGLPALTVAWAVAAFYVAIGLWAWYRHRRIVITTGPGQLLGDFWYHGILSLPAPLLLMSMPPWAHGALLLVCGITWWQLDTAGYGPVRSPEAP
jgi:hypothetical protein